jgi:hypothetical protein
MSKRKAPAGSGGRTPKKSIGLLQFFKKTPAVADTDTNTLLEATNSSASCTETVEPAETGNESNDHELKPCHIIDISTIPIYSCGGRTWRFNVEWYQLFPWLHWCNGKLLCHICLTAMQTPGLVLTKRVEDAFSNSGAAFIWKNAPKAFRKHSNSQVHLESVQKLAVIKIKTSVVCLLDKQIAQEQADAKVALKAISTTLLTLAQTGSTIRGLIRCQLRCSHSAGQSWAGGIGA